MLALKPQLVNLVWSVERASEKRETGPPGPPSLLRIHSQTQQLNSSQPPLPPSPSPSPSPPPQYLNHVFRLFGPLGQCISPFREGNCSGLLDCPLLNTKPHSFDLKTQNHQHRPVNTLGQYNSIDEFLRHRKKLYSVRQQQRQQQDKQSLPL